MLLAACHEALIWETLPVCFPGMNSLRHECRYQVCVFCHKKIELFCNNLCPGCRTEYGTQKDMFDPAGRQSSTDISSPSPGMPLTPAKHMLAQGTEAATPHTHQPGAKPNGLQQAGWPALWGQAADRSGHHASSLAGPQPAAEGASAWPSLAASQRQASGNNAHAPSTSQPPQPQHPATGHTSAWQNQQTDQQQQGMGVERTRIALSAPLTTGQVPSVQADPDGAALLQKVQSAVGNGELSIEDGTKQLVAFLRQREQTNKGKSPKPPPGFAVAANAQANASLLGKPQQPSLLTDAMTPNRSDNPSAASLFPPFPAMQPSSSSTASQPTALLSNPQSQHLGQSASSHPMPQWGQASPALSFQQWAQPNGADNLTCSSRSSMNSSGTTVQGSPATTGLFPVDLVAASAALWSAPAAGISNADINCCFACFCFFTLSACSQCNCHDDWSAHLHSVAEYTMKLVHKMCVCC